MEDLFKLLEEERNNNEEMLFKELYNFYNSLIKGGFSTDEAVKLIANLISRER